MQTAAAGVKPGKEKTVYAASRIKRHRRTKAELADFRQSIITVLESIHPATLRQLFYQMVIQQLIPKLESEYDAVGRNLLFLRREGEVPYSWVSDNTRWQRKPRSFSSVEDAIDNCVRTYRKNIWVGIDRYVEVWVEKDALAGVMFEETATWDVPLMVSRGFSSDTYLNECAESIKDLGKPAWLYYFGDRDPSGVCIDQTIERRLRAMAPDAEIHFQRVAVTPEQIVELQLPTRPTKKSDSRSRNFEGESVELDSIEPARLRLMVRECIEQHVDSDYLARMKTVEAAERQTAREFVARFKEDR